MPASKTLKFTALFLLMGFNLLFSLFCWKNETPIAERVNYQDSLRAFEKRKQHFHVEHLNCSWNATPILPKIPVNLMGYNPRGAYISVNDTPTVKTLLIDAGEVSIAIISYDLMMTPPDVAKGVRKELNDKGIIPFFTATHNHSSFGNWLNGGPIASYIAGEYDQGVVDYVVQQTLNSIQASKQNLEESTIYYFTASGEGLIQNRIADELPVGDSTIRGLEIETVSGRKAIWCSFSAHPTVITGDTLNITGDYPTTLCDSLMIKDNYEFASFSAGMVGSHKAKFLRWSSNSGRCKELYGSDLYHRIHLTKKKEILKPSSIYSGILGVPLGEEELSIIGPFKLRPWIFNLIVGNPQESATINFLKIGDLSLIGVPCDYSASLDNTEPFKDKTIITSFNGGYIGYATHDEIQNYAHQENSSMSWYGPSLGAYLKLLNESL